MPLHTSWISRPLLVGRKPVRKKKKKLKLRIISLFFIFLVMIYHNFLLYTPLFFILTLYNIYIFISLYTYPPSIKMGVQCCKQNCMSRLSLNIKEISSFIEICQFLYLKWKELFQYNALFIVQKSSSLEYIYFCPFFFFDIYF
jgi:hypothetical protein